MPGIGVQITLNAELRPPVQPPAGRCLRSPAWLHLQSVRAAYSKWKLVGRPTIRRYLISVEGYTQSQVRAAERCLK